LATVSETKTKAALGHGETIMEKYYVVWSVKDLESFYVYSGPMETFDDIHRCAMEMKEKMGLPSTPLIKNWKRIS
jgi:hypothetical protein